jgi:hypothetical protein
VSGSHTRLTMCQDWAAGVAATADEAAMPVTARIAAALAAAPRAVRPAHRGRRPGRPAPPSPGGGGAGLGAAPPGAEIPAGAGPLTSLSF